MSVTRAASPASLTDAAKTSPRETNATFLPSGESARSSNCDVRFTCSGVGPVGAPRRTMVADVEEIDLPPDPSDRIHSWHLFPIRLRLDRLAIDRNEFMLQLRACGVGCSVHWRPLHLHPYYEETFAWRPDHLPTASAQWLRLISLPLFPGMSEEEFRRVVAVIRELCYRYRGRIVP